MTTSIGEALINQLAARGVEVVFGIPGVHTIELYRGLARSKIRHVTSRHEQGAGFMADGYCRASGKVGVAFVITGPGLTNILTPMAQARADSIPMLVISSVNKTTDLGRGMGHLHELPNQLATSKTVAIDAMQVSAARDLEPMLARAFDRLTGGRPGPVHIEIPMDVLAQPYHAAEQPTRQATSPTVNTDLVTAACEILTQAKKPVILAGGGAKNGEAELLKLAMALDAPVVQSTNARGLMYGNALSVPASASLPAIRDLLADADVVLGVGTELGPTDIDMYRDDGFPDLAQLIRIDVSAEQLARHACSIALHGAAQAVLPAIHAGLNGIQKSANGAARAAVATVAARDGLSGETQEQIMLLENLRDAFPAAIMVGDSTQLIYSGNLFYEHDRPSGWFNAATGFGALGFAIPASIGAAMANPGDQVICIAGDGGAQFSIAELMTAVDEKLPILFVIWNNNGFGEIETSMRDVGAVPVGCDPTAPDFSHVAAACGMDFVRCSADPSEVVAAMKSANLANGPAMIEIKIDAPTRPNPRG